MFCVYDRSTYNPVSLCVYQDIDRTENLQRSDVDGVSCLFVRLIPFSDTCRISQGGGQGGPSLVVR